MNQERKRLSDCPADRLAQCRGKAVQARCHALQGLLNKADQRIDDLTHPAPVGDVEVLGYSVKGNRYAIRLTKTELLELYEGYAGDALVELVDRAHVTRLEAKVSALQQRMNIADQRASDLSWLAKSAYLEGWELGWVTRHTDANNEKRVTPWAPPREVMEREWLTSECRAALSTSMPPADRKGQLKKG